MMKTRAFINVLLFIFLLGINSCYADATAMATANDPTATTPTPDLYQVNLIVFEHITPRALGSEQWSAITNPPDTADSVEPTLLPDDQSQLKIEARRLKRKIAQKENYNTLLNIAWQQTIPVSRHAQPIHISSDKIDGTITITRDRYFNVTSKLILSEPADYLDMIGPGNYTDTIINDDPKTFQSFQTQRMRSNELNFIDHPLFGILIKIMPVKTAPDQITS
ncbi:MAG: hypothetical protein KAT71_03215 [Gammaproteobacteria bacterium]|nr:hypothetical protein [Gammaproteobacteria bacterium]